MDGKDVPGGDARVLAGALGCRWIARNYFPTSRLRVRTPCALK